MANIGMWSNTTSSITMYVYNLDTAYSGNDRWIDWYCGGSYYGQSSLGAYVSSGGQFTFNGLASGTQYYIAAYIYYGNGQYNVQLSSYASTQVQTDPYYYPGGSLITNSVTQNSLSVYLSGLNSYSGSYTRSVDLYVGGSRVASTTISNYSTSSPVLTASGLSSGTQYKVQVQIYYSSQGTIQMSYYDAYITTTSPYSIGSPIISVTSRSANSINVYMYGMNAPALATRTIDWYLNNSYVGQTSVTSTSATSSASFTFSGLSINTAYTLRGDITYYTGSTWTASAFYKYNVPTTFSWASYGTAPTTSQSTFYIPKATAWNALTQNINNVRSYKGYSSYSFTSVRGASNGYSTSNSTRVTATIYNQARSAIRGISGYGTYIPQMSIGSPLYQYYWYVLQSELNSVI